jgi:hypothetical protein
MFIIGSVVPGLAVARIIAILHWRFKNVQDRRVARTNQLDAKEAERQRSAQRRKSRIFSPVGIQVLQAARIDGPVNADAVPWAGTSAYGYGRVVRDDVRRKRLTPSDYVHGVTHRKTKQRLQSGSRSDH